MYLELFLVNFPIAGYEQLALPAEQIGLAAEYFAVAAEHFAVATEQFAVENDFRQNVNLLE